MTADPLTVLLSAFDAGDAAHVEVTVVRDGQTATYAQTYPALATLPADSRAGVGAGMETPAESGALSVAPDPLDENDHRDRIDAEGGRWCRHGHEHWHTAGVPCWHRPNRPHSLPLAWINDAYGPLRFAESDA